jgi:AraC-like DNA-binding protein
MKPQLLKLNNDSVNSFSVRRDIVPDINNCWHCHPEIEFIYFKSGNGTQFVGDSIKRFQSGDVVLIGPFLPHYWRFDDAYFKDEAEAVADVRVIHFKENFWGKDFINLPENKLIKSLIDCSKRGVSVKVNTSHDLGTIFDELIDDGEANKIILLIEALIIAGQSDYEQLSSIVFNPNLEDTDKDRINAIYDYSLKNFKSQIKLEEIAEIANISPSSFCRYFKLKTQKTYTRFINEIRIGNACKLLIENDINVKQICYECGYNNFASFYKFFKSITDKSPLNYQKEFLVRSKQIAHLIE